MPPNRPLQKRAISDVMRPGRHNMSTAIKRPAPAANTQLRPMRRPIQMLNYSKSSLGWKDWLQIAVIALVVIVAGFLLKLLPLGQLAVIAYGVVALVRHIKSHTSFKLALVALGLVLPLMLIGQRLLAENFAAYAFLFIAVALLSALLETRRHSQVEDNAVYTTLEKASAKRLN